MGIRSFFIILICLSVSSCSGSQTLAPVTVHGQSSGAGSAGIHSVDRGDTLYSVSTRYRLSMRDIAVINHLQPPFTLYEGQRLKLPPPQDYRVRAGDTLYGISRLFGVSSTEVARLNNIQSPYIVQQGSVLRLPSATRHAQKSAKLAQATSTEMTRAPVQNVESSVLPPDEPKMAMIKDGVPLPQSKPQAYHKPKSVKVTKVIGATPKRASSKFLSPVRGKIISNYGAKKNGLHNDGINIAAARGTSVIAAENGVVVYAGNALKGSGNLVLVRHENQWMTAYGHLDRISVAKGQVIKRGSILGKVGSTGSVATPQLHFEVRRGTTAMNPTKYME